MNYNNLNKTEWHFWPLQRHFKEHQFIHLFRKHLLPPVDCWMLGLQRWMRHRAWPYIRYCLAYRIRFKNNLTPIMSEEREEKELACSEELQNALKVILEGSEGWLAHWRMDCREREEPSKGTNVGDLSFHTAGVKDMFSFKALNEYLNARLERCCCC